MTSFTIRRAGAEDAQAVTAMHQQSWRETYSHPLPAEFFTAADTKSQEEKVQARRRFLADSFEVPGSARIWMGIDDDGTVVGLAGSDPARDEDIATRIPLELQMIYVLNRAQGTGLAQELLGAAIGAAPSFLWVFRNNPRAERFYARNGFAPDGAAKQAGPRLWHLEEFRMVRR